MERFFTYQSKQYSVGTKVKFKFMYNLPEVGTVEDINDDKILIRLTDGTPYWVMKTDNAITEILQPVYYVEKNKTLPPCDDVFYGWIFYIIVMAVGLIFKDRWIIWVAATILFFTWKKGLWGRK